MLQDTSLVDSFPFSSCVKSNYVPSDEEAVQIKAFLTEPRKQLDEMKVELRRLHAEVVSLEMKCDSLHHQITSCSALITLPRRLPYDVLEEIFYQTLPTDRNALLCRNSVPLILTLICRHWRQVAFSAPRLWSTIHVQVVPKYRNPLREPSSDSLPQKWDETQATAISEWIKRSGNLPLHISFFASDMVCPSPAMIDIYLRHMVPFSSRWKSLVLQGPPTYLDRIFTLETAHWRSLELLILDFECTEPGSSEELIYSWSQYGLFTAPSLRKLSIREVTMLRDPMILGIHWGQLTHLDIGAPPRPLRAGMMLPLPLASQILHLSKCLIYCQIRIRGWRDAPQFLQSVPAPHIRLMQLPLLRSLSIVMEGYTLPFTEKLKIPALQQLSLQIVEDEMTRSSVDYYTCLAPLFHAEQGTIQKLAIDTRYLDHGSFLETLRKCPDLISLTLKRASEQRGSWYPSRQREAPPIRIDNQFLESISSNKSDILCSQLEEFICDCNIEFYTTDVIGFIERKQSDIIPNLAKLKKIATPLLSRIFEDPREGPVFKFPDELRPYISQGLVFHDADSWGA